MKEFDKCCNTCIWCVQDEDLVSDIYDIDEDKLQAGECSIGLKKFLGDKKYCDSYFASLNFLNNYVVYDETYLGPGYFIVSEIGGEIQRFVKLYISNNYGFPLYNIRAYEVGSFDSKDEEFRKIIFSTHYEDDKELFRVIDNLAGKLIDKNIESINKLKNGSSYLGAISSLIFSRLIVSKDIWHGRDLCGNFIDLELGDNYSCDFYDEINVFYNELASIAVNRKDFVNKVLKLAK